MPAALLADTAALLAHQGGWDEALMVLVPVAIFAVLLRTANQRAKAQQAGAKGGGKQTGKQSGKQSGNQQSGGSSKKSGAAATRAGSKGPRGPI